MTELTPQDAADMWFPPITLTGNETLYISTPDGWYRLDGDTLVPSGAPVVHIKPDLSGELVEVGVPEVPDGT